MYHASFSIDGSKIMAPNPTFADAPSRKVVAMSNEYVAHPAK